ncbi:MAG: DUF4465 domain-containing protein [Desulfobacterales bacterium]
MDVMGRFSYSNLTDTTVEGISMLNTAITGSGKDNSEIYAVCYVSAFAQGPPTITLTRKRSISGAYFTNTNYAYYSMKNHDFSRKFTDDDWFLAHKAVVSFDAQGENYRTVSFKSVADGTNIVIPGPGWI